MASEEVIREAAAACWRRGNLSYKLDATQLRLYRRIKRTPQKEFSTEGARKLGKSYVHGAIVLETAAANPGKQINWVTGTKLLCRQVLLPILQELSEDAPDEFKGRYDSENSRWLLPNGAYVRLVGAETQADIENSRGPSCILVVVDEAGFINLLEYLIDSVMAPQMRRVPRQPGTFIGMTLLVSTTPFFPSHHFCRRADIGSLNGAYQKLTVHDSGWETPEQIAAFIASEAMKKGLGVEEFMATPGFRREYLSERVIDEQHVVFPEFHRTRDKVVRVHPRPYGFETYVWKRHAIDLGMSDKTGMLLGYVDFTAAKIVVERELLLTRPNTSAIAAHVREQEGALWPNASPHRTSRVVDDPHGRVVLDLWDLERLRFDKAIKHDRAASIGMIRTHLTTNTLVIDPSCLQLQRQLLEATPSNSGKDFAAADDGHYDLCAALMYFVRGLSLTLNPYPPDFDVTLGREKPAHHPLVARREAMHATKPRGLEGAIFANNRYVGAAQKKRTRY